MRIKYYFKKFFCFVFGHDTVLIYSHKTSNQYHVKFIIEHNTKHLCVRCDDAFSNCVQEVV